MKDELKELRHLPEIQNIAEYLRKMEFRRKLFGGVDPESVLEHFSAVTLQYEAVVSAFMRQAADSARRLAEAEARLRAGDAQSARQWVMPPPSWPQQQHAQLMQQMQPQTYQNPWGACDPWAQQPYTPQTCAPQAYTY
ncbi:MAG: hypothetical protein FWE98_00930 [Oscillospiraceae bacterium]|nr:hypothetical protein [Oscillospiraceae bacterium]